MPLPYDPNMPPPLPPPAPPPYDDSTPSTRYPVVHGCLLGGAIGDALGAPVESLSMAQIRERYGPYGVTGECTPFGTDERNFDGRISEETQLALLTMDATLRAHVRVRARGTAGLLTRIAQVGYIDWLVRQGEPLLRQPLWSNGSLGGLPVIDSPRGASRTVVEAMRRAAQRDIPALPLGTRTEPINDSKGSAAVVRVAACGFDDDLSASFANGCDIAALTHGHPSAWLAAGTFAAIISSLYTQTPLRDAITHAQTELGRQPHHEEVSAAVASAIALADKSTPATASPEPLGTGWTAPEAWPLRSMPH